MTTEDTLPRFCYCGGSVFSRSPITGFWNCHKCGSPKEIWWRAHKNRLDRLARQGLCTKGASSSGWRGVACRAVQRYE